MTPFSPPVPSTPEIERVVSDVLHETGAWRTTLSVPTRTCEYLIAAAGHDLGVDPDADLPIQYSICRFVAEMAHPLVIDDAFSHPLMKGHPAVENLGVAAYVGIPVATLAADDMRLILCAIKIKRYRWSDRDIATMHAAADRIRNSLPGLADTAR